MRAMTAFLSLLVTTSTVFAAEPNLENQKTAVKASMAMTKINMDYMGDRLDLQLFSVTEKGLDVKVEIGIGSTDRPARMHNCVTVSFSDTGYITNISNDIDADSCK